YRQLPQELRDEYSMVIAGRIGWNCQAEEAALAEAVADGFDVRHLGYVDEDTRTALFKNATLFVSASNYEGYGMPVIEAMAAGVPVAISDIPVFREVAQENAFYFDQTKPTTIAAIIQEALLDDKRRTRLSIAGLNRVAQFDWDRVTTNIHDKIIETLHSN
ncbi:glycosyltransferase, partial [Candidatus Saccharibacteria bacterium]|nr:glycosyltransferase [Candidatus Saccharibacteria bacterium]